ncbi:MAG: HlyD family type I secretion periplasmic adaptor subunit [Alphaproteobacteria bacterium]|nr:HlyD family type I secretion periplasmic adaptor subunit [Alphaproteobacteria bacterium]
MLTDGGQSRQLRLTLAAIVLLVAGLIGWAIVAEVDELARARGEVQPAGNIQTLQSEEGGTIVRLYVEEGAAVREGDVVAEFVAADIESLIAQRDVKSNALSIQRETMEALIDERDPDFSPYEERFPDLVEQASDAYQSRLAGLQAGLEAKRSEISARETTLAGAREQARLIAQEAVEAQNRLDRLQEGVDRGVVPLNRLSEVRQQVVALEERRADALSRASSAESEIAGLNQELIQLTSEFRTTLSQDMSEVTEQIEELSAEMTALQERRGRIELTATVDGIVMDLPETREGAVVAPGGVVARIVPTREEVVMAVMVPPRDIGFVREGQAAMVKIDSFDSARFGVVDGTVRFVAPTSTKRERDGAPFYEVEIALAKPYVGSQEHRLMPGMTGEADIATGRKTVMQYLLKPLFLASDTAFHER